MRFITHRRFNNVLTLVVVGLGLYITMTPLLPQITYTIRDKSPEASAPYVGELAETVGSASSTERPDENRIVIPSIQVNEPVLEGGNIWVINDGGTWRRPDTATPTEDNNTVIVGHRFFGSNVSTFYHLDKVLMGQKLALYWEGEEILYEVTETKIVDATAIEIEGPTATKQLTIYTCHPVWTARQRLVVIAKPVADLERAAKERSVNQITSLLPGNQDSTITPWDQALESAGVFNERNISFEGA